MINTTEALRQWAQGDFPREAGVELLIRIKVTSTASPWICTEGTDRYVDGDAIVENIDHLPGGQQRVMRIAAALLGGARVNLSNNVAGLDRAHLELVLAAIAHAAGSHEHSAFNYDANGRPTGYFQLGAAYPWPPA